MTIDEFYKEVKRQMAEKGMAEDAEIAYIDTDFLFDLNVVCLPKTDIAIY